MGSEMCIRDSLKEVAERTRARRRSTTRSALHTRALPDRYPAARSPANPRGLLPFALRRRVNRRPHLGQPREGWRKRPSPLLTWEEQHSKGRRSYCSSSCGGHGGDSTASADAIAAGPRTRGVANLSARGRPERTPVFRVRPAASNHSCSRRYGCWAVSYTHLTLPTILRV